MTSRKQTRATPTSLSSRGTLVRGQIHLGPVYSVDKYYWKEILKRVGSPARESVAEKLARRINELIRRMHSGMSVVSTNSDSIIK